jgi:hypothetical protein
MATAYTCIDSTTSIELKGLPPEPCQQLRAERTCPGSNGVNDPGCSLVVNGDPGHYTKQVPKVPERTKMLV